MTESQKKTEILSRAHQPGIQVFLSWWPLKSSQLLKQKSWAFLLGSVRQATCWVFFLLRWRGWCYINGIKETLFMGSIRNRNVAVKVIRLEFKRIGSSLRVSLKGFLQVYSSTLISSVSCGKEQCTDTHLHAKKCARALLIPHSKDCTVHKHKYLLAAPLSHPFTRSIDSRNQTTPLIKSGRKH